MMYEYEAYDEKGSRIKDTIQASSLEAAYALIESNKLHLLSIKKKNESKVGLFFEKNKLTLDDLEFLTSELSLLLKNDVKIDRGLDILSKTKKNSYLGKVISELSISVKRGTSLAEALGQYKDFDQLYVNLVKMGEASGELTNVFGGLERDLKYKRELKNKIMQAMTYPMVIFTVCILAVFFVFNFIVPQMSSLFDDSMQLPFYTSVIISLSNWMIAYQWYFLGGLFLTCLGLKYFVSGETLKNWWDINAIKAPVLRHAVLQVERIRFNTSMGLMLEAGVKLDTAIKMAAETVKNTFIREEIIIASNSIKTGTSVSSAFSSNSLFPDLYLSLLEVGEESGQLGVVFEEIANRSRAEFTSWTNRLTSILEPAMILFMALIVGSVVVTMLLSIISVNDSF